MRDLWDVWLVPYLTCAEVVHLGDLPRRRVAFGLAFDAAARLVESLGFGHSMHPAQP